MSMRFGPSASVVSFVASAAATSSGRTGTARRTSGSTARGAGRTGVATAIAVGTGVAEGAAMVGVLFIGGAVAARRAGDSTGCARGATIVATAGVGLGVAVAAASGGRGVIRCRLDIKRRNQNPAIRIAIPIRNGSNEGRVLSVRRVTGVRGALGAGVSCK